METFTKVALGMAALHDINKMVENASEQAYEAGYQDALDSDDYEAIAVNKNITRDREGHVIESGSGIFMCGVDLMPGTYRLTALRKENEKITYNVYYEVGDNPNELDAEKTFYDQTYVVVEEGQFLAIESIESSTKVRFERIR